ncbi:MAG TPA: hypothetical protein VGE67_18730 [Haloferula sp.]
MALFDGIQLVLEDGFSADEAAAVTMRSRSMINFIEGRLAAYGFESEFTKLNIHVSKSPVSGQLIRDKEPKRFIGISIQLDPGDFLEPLATFHEACATMVRSGFDAASRHVDLPCAEVAKAIDEFFEGNFENRWIHAEKSWKRAGIRSVILCELLPDAFILTQQIYRSEELIGESMIARTKPREWLFYRVLGGLTLSGSQLLYRGKDHLISSFDLDTGKFEISEHSMNEPFVLEAEIRVERRR